MSDDGIEITSLHPNPPPSSVENQSNSHQTRASWQMIASHFLTRMGDKMWEFIIPLALIAISPQTLLPAALFGTAVTLVRVLFGTSIGKQIDKRGRITMINWGIGGQAISVFVSSISLYFLLDMVEDKDIKLKMESNIFYNWKSILLVVVLLISSAMGSLCANIMDIAVERDWVPTAIQIEQYLTLTNTRMRQVDLLTEVGGPLLAGLVPLIPVTLQYSFTIIAAFNYIVEEAVMVLAAAVVFSLPFHDTVLEDIFHYVFLVFLLLSRIGLYGFEVGQISILQQGIPENVRGQVNSVETSLTSLASLVVFLGGFVLSNPEYFIYLVWGSTFFVVCGALTFLGWYVFSGIRKDYQVIK